MKRFFILIIFLTVYTSVAQSITILDIDSKFPIVNVVVFNEDKSKRVVSDKDGVVNISDFLVNDILTFSHVAYVEFELLKRVITGKKIIYLRSKSEQLQEVFLSASKGKESRKRIAEQIAIFSIKDIQKTAPQTSADMLAEIPGIKVQKSQAGGGSPVLRGMEANRVLLVVDGVRMNNAIYRKGHLQNAITVSPNMLDRTEVIFGPSSVIYGSDALGGVIHYYTRKPTVSDKNNANVSVLNRYSSVNDEFTVHAGIELSFKKIGSYTSVSHSKFGDLRMGKNRNHGFDDWGKVFEYSNNSNSFYNPNPVINSNPEIQRNTGYDQTDILQKFFIPLSKKTDVTFNFQYSTSSDIPRFDRLTEYRDGELRFAEWYYGPQKRLLVSSQLQINPHKKWLDNGSIILAYQNIKESRINRRFTSLNRTIRKENVDVFSVNGDFYVPLTKAKDRILSYGLEFTFNDVDSNSEGKTLSVNDPDSNQGEITGFSGTFPVQSRYADGGSTYTTSAVYVNYRQDISKKSTLNTGMRFTNTYLTARWIDDTFITLPDSDISLNNSAVTATLSYIYKPIDNWQFNGVLSSGFRSPNIDDVGKVRERRGDVTVPNVNLKPEFAYSAELGILKYFNDKKLYVGLTTYYTLLDNYIIRDNFLLNGSSTILFDGELGNIVANVNNNTAYILGGTFNFKGDIGNNFKTRASFTYTKGKAYDTNEPLSSIPPFFGLLELSHEKGRLEMGLDFKYNGRKKPKDYNITEGIDRIEQTPIIDANAIDAIDKYYGSPSWTTFNFRSKYRLSKNFDFLFAVDNIFDTHYKEFASGISAPGRNFSFSLLVNF
ncbi:MAG: TonB-dependent receptor [Flavobacteriaceae bacterium]|nr:TonB-dependent receptor [Flavobacteriaceae bacterium]